MSKNNTNMTCPHDTDTFDKIQLPAANHLAAHNTGKAGNKQNTQRKNDIVASRSHQADKDQRQKNTGEGKQHIVEPHHHIIYPAAEISGQSSYQRSEKAADGHGADGYKKGTAASIHHTA